VVTDALVGEYVVVSLRDATGVTTLSSLVMEVVDVVPQYTIDIRRGKNDVFPEMRPEILEELKTHELFSALGIARRLHHKGITATTIEHAYKNYRIICEEFNVQPNGEGAFSYYLTTLETIGILGIVKKTIKGRKGIRSRLTIHDVPAAVLIERIDVFITQRFQSTKD